MRTTDVPEEKENSESGKRHPTNKHIHTQRERERETKSDIDRERERKRGAYRQEVFAGGVQQ